MGENRGGEMGRVVRRIGWLLGDRGLRIFTDLVLNGWIAGYLGAAEFGLQVYALSIAGLLQPLAALSLDTFSMHLLAQGAARERVLGTALALKCAVGAASWALVSVAAWMLHPSGGVVVLYVVLAGSLLVFRSLEVTDIWFQASGHLHYGVWSRAAATAIFAVVKLALIGAHAAPLWFIAAAALEVLSVGVLAFVLLRRAHGGRVGWVFDRGMAREMLGRCWPLVASAFCVSTYLRAAPVLLVWFSSPQQAGIFGAANRLAEVMHFLPGAIVAAWTPWLLGAHGRSKDDFERALQAVVTALVWVGVVTGVAAAVVGPLAVRVLYGAEFGGSAIVMALLAAGNPFVFGTAANGIWTTAERLERYALARLLATAIGSVALQATLIPSYGAIGAGVGLLFGHVGSGFLFHLAMERTRPSAQRIVRAFLPAGWRALRRTAAEMRAHPNG
jgi:O-antigen/teichoic acid export membrane protein